MPQTWLHSSELSLALCKEFYVSPVLALSYGVHSLLQLWSAAISDGALGSNYPICILIDLLHVNVL